MSTLDVALRLRLVNEIKAGASAVQKDLAGVKAAAEKLSTTGRTTGKLGADLNAAAGSAKRAETAIRGVANVRLDRATREADKLAKSYTAVGKAAKAAHEGVLGRAAQGAIATAGSYLGARAIIGGTVGQAISFEKAMAEVKKKVDGADDPRVFADIERQVNEMARAYGIARGEMAGLTAEAGAAGIATADLGRFMNLTAKAAVGWDMLPREASEKLAYIKASTQESIPFVEELADKINMLGDSSAAKERDVVEMFLRSGAAAKAAGVDYDTTLAILTALRSQGMEPEVASRFFNALTSKLAAAKDASPKASAAFKELGLTTAGVAKQMKTDARGTILDFLDRLVKAKDPVSVATRIMGEGFQDELSRLTKTIPEVNKYLALLAKPASYEGSLGKGLNIQLATTESHLKRLSALASEVGDRLGRWALPGINDNIERVLKLFDASSVTPNTPVVLPGSTPLAALPDRWSGISKTPSGPAPRFTPTEVERFAAEIKAARAAERSVPITEPGLIRPGAFLKNSLLSESRGAAIRAGGLTPGQSIERETAIEAEVAKIANAYRVFATSDQVTADRKGKAREAAESKLRPLLDELMKLDRARNGQAAPAVEEVDAALREVMDVTSRAGPALKDAGQQSMQQLGDGFRQEMGAIESEFGAFMGRLRQIAGAGLNVPITTSGGSLDRGVKQARNRALHDIDVGGMVG